MPLVSTVSAGVIMEEVVRLTVNHGQTISYPSSALAGLPALSFGLIHIGAVQLLVLVISVVLVLTLGYIIRSTWYGRAMRAMAQSPDVTAVLGVDTARIAATTFALSSALTGAGGVLFGLIYASFDPYFGGIIGIKALAVVLLGGLGSLGGAAVGGILIGLVEALATGYLPTSWENAFAFGIMMVILLVRPGGLAGSRQRLD
jgi:branched-chain amino acid transport system permease protein